MKDELIKYFKMNLKSFIILTYLKTLRLYSNGNLHLKYYNIEWLIGIGSSLFASTYNHMFGSKITKQLLKIYDKDEIQARETVAVALSIIYVLLFRYLYMKIFYNRTILNEKYFQVTIISILSVTFYSITIKPFFNNSHTGKFFNSIINDSILLLSSDFIEDAKIDSNAFDIEINTIGTFFRIIINAIL